VLIAVNPTRWKQIFWFEGGGEEVQFSCDLGWTRVFLGRRSSLYCFRSFGSKEEEEKKYSLFVIWGGQGFFWEGGVLYTVLDPLVRRRRRRRSTV